MNQTPSALKKRIKQLEKEKEDLKHQYNVMREINGRLQQHINGGMKQHPNHRPNYHPNHHPNHHHNQEYKNPFNTGTKVDAPIFSDYEGGSNMTNYGTGVRNNDFLRRRQEQESARRRQEQEQELARRRQEQELARRRQEQELARRRQIQIQKDEEFAKKASTNMNRNQRRRTQRKFNTLNESTMADRYGRHGTGRKPSYKKRKPPPKRNTNNRRNNNNGRNNNNNNNNYNGGNNDKGTFYFEYTKPKLKYYI